ncbi:hypothetical protein GCM10027027_08800 [Neomicrococcus lactis]
MYDVSGPRDSLRPGILCYFMPNRDAPPRRTTSPVTMAWDARATTSKAGVSGLPRRFGNGTDTPLRTGL